MSVSASPAPAARKTPDRLSFLKLAGPGLVVAATGIGSGDVVAATVGGARYGVVLLWAIAVGAFFKYVLNEGIARWQLATGKTALEGWAEYLPPWVKYTFAAYLVVWTVAVTAALTNATGLGIANLTGGRIPQSWGSILHSLFGFGFVLLGGYGGFEKLMKTLVGVMGFSILVCAGLTFHDPASVVRGTLVPTIPGGAGFYVLSIVGGIGGSVTMLSYNYWMREENISGPEQVSYVRGDIAIAYLFTALFGMAIMMTANQAFYIPGVAITNAQAVPKMAEMLGSILGTFGRVAYSVGFWAAVFASLLGVWQSVPYLYADFYSIITKMSPEERKRATAVTSAPYRIALAFVTFAPMAFAFTGQPIQVIVVYTIVGSVFVPFLAATLLYLNNRVRWTGAVPKNGWLTNGLLVVILGLFVVIWVDEIRRAIG